MSSATLIASEPFVPQNDANALWNALNADKTDVAAIINVLAKRTLDQRLEIILKYKGLFNSDLVQELQSKLSGDLKNLITAMMTRKYQYFAEELHKAVAGFGTDEADLIEVLCTSKNDEIKTIENFYQELYNVRLEDDIVDDTSGQFKDLLVSLCKTERNENMPENEDDAKTDAQAIVASNSDTRWKIFSDILEHRSYAQLRLIFETYQTLAGDSIENAITKGFSGDVKEGLLAIVAAVKNPARFFAKKLNQSMVGLGTRNADLIRVVVTRSEIDMVDIKKEYLAQFGNTLAADIIDDTSGDYKTCLLILIGETEEESN